MFPTIWLGLRELGSLRGARVGTGSARGGLALAKRFGRFYRSLNPTHTCRQGALRSEGTRRSPKGRFYLREWGAVPHSRHQCGAGCDEGRSQVLPAPAGRFYP